MDSTRSIRRTLPLLSVVLVPMVAFVACGGGGDGQRSAADANASSDAAATCAVAQPSPAAVAVTDYIATATPKPLRFLTAAASDSALPDDALRIIQDKGPTFYWLGDDKSQQQIREKLDRDGDWETLLVVFRGESTDDEGRRIVNLGGRYVGKPNDGQEAPSTRYVLTCTPGPNAEWTIVTNAAAGSA